MNVREKLSLCYYCSARLIRGKGIIVIQSGIEKENRQKVLDEINRQLDIMKNGEFSDEDFEASKKPYATHTAASTILPMRLTYITARS